MAISHHRCALHQALPPLCERLSVENEKSALAALRDALDSMLSQFLSTTEEDVEALKAGVTKEALVIPTQADVLKQWASTLQRDKGVYCKTSKMHAKLALDNGVLKTVVDGVVETEKSYEKGDFIMHGTEGERYTMSAIDFSVRYERARPEPASTRALVEEGFQQYTPTGKIWAHMITKEEISTHFPAGQFIAPWGSEMIVEPDDFLAMPFPSGGEVYRIKGTAFDNTYTLHTRLKDYVPSQAEALAHWEGALRSDGCVFCKTTKMHAKLVVGDGVLETVVDGVVETRKMYKAGDFLLHGTQGERYSIGAVDFAARYERTQPEAAADAALAREGFQLFKPTGKIWAKEISTTDIETHFPAKQFIASWGSPMVVEGGDYLAMPFPSGGELYRIKRSAFDNTYSPDIHVPSQAETLAQWEDALKNDPTVYRKTSQMHAKLAGEDGILQTIIDGVLETEKPYEKGDFILHGTQGERYTMSALDFSMRYERDRPMVSEDAALHAEGFAAYLAKGKIWGREISSEEVTVYFPSGQFIAAWGSPMVVEGGDFLAMPYPAGGEIYRIKRSAFESTYALHTLHDYVPSQGEVIATWEEDIQQEGNIYSKFAMMHAKVATEAGVLETVIEGFSETSRNYRKGDFILHGTKGERYSMGALDFSVRYERALPEPATDPQLAEEGFMLYRPTGKVWAIELTVEDIKEHFPSGKFMAKWGSPMMVEAGDILVMPFPMGGELYSVRKAAFVSTYAPADFVPSQVDTLSEWGPTLQRNANVYCKTAKIFARIANEAGSLDTVVKGFLETSHTYEKGDFIVRGTEGEEYVVSALDFTLRYDRARPERPSEQELLDKGFQLYRPTGKIWAYKVTADILGQYFPAGQFVASWGSTMAVEEGDFLVMPFPTGNELYRIKKAHLESTYALHTMVNYVPSQHEVYKHWEGQMKHDSTVFCKTTKMHAMLALADGVLETVVNGVTETHKCYKKGDFIMHGTEGERYVMGPIEFSDRYERSRPEPAAVAALADEGFQQYRPTGKIWAHELTVEETVLHFPSGQFIASWGSPMEVEAGDFLAMPCPAGGEVYRIKRSAFGNTYSPDQHVPSQAETVALWQGPLRHEGGVYCKTAQMHAKLALDDGVLETIVDGIVETSKTYEKGDFILHGTQGERYTMAALDFSVRYERNRPTEATEPALVEEGFKRYQAKGKIWGFEVTEEDVQRTFPAAQFIAAWGSPMVIEAGDFLAMPFPQGGEIYRIKRSAFDNTYTPHTLDGYVPSQADALAHWEGALRQGNLVFCKTTKVNAKLATDEGVLETVVNGVVETRKAYKKGDFILQGTEGERYTMAADSFSVRYEALPEPANEPLLAAEGFKLYRPTGKIWGRELSEQDLVTHFPAGQFMASWGSVMEVRAGDFLAMPFPAGGELYRIEEKAFASTYKLYDDTESDDEDAASESSAGDHSDDEPAVPKDRRTSKTMDVLSKGAARRRSSVGNRKASIEALPTAVAESPRPSPRAPPAGEGLRRRSSAMTEGGAGGGAGDGGGAKANAALRARTSFRRRTSNSGLRRSSAGAIDTTNALVASIPEPPSASTDSPESQARRLLAISVRLPERQILEATRSEAARRLQALETEEDK